MKWLSPTRNFGRRAWRRILRTWWGWTHRSQRAPRLEGGYTVGYLAFTIPLDGHTPNLPPGVMLPLRRIAAAGALAACRITTADGQNPSLLFVGEPLQTFLTFDHVHDRSDRR